MAPLGIVTAIVGAIRVGGPTWLKAVIGRARENRAAAEMELMSSTSHEVGELWNGSAIVKTMGSPQVLQLLYFEDQDDQDGSPGGGALHTVETAVAAGLLERECKPDILIYYLLLTAPEE